jgi:hypothetical protein
MTEVKGIALSPDSTQFAFRLASNHYRNPIGLAALFMPFRYAHCDFELYTFDFTKHTGPRRIGSWRRKPDEEYAVQIWDRSGIVLDHRALHQERAFWAERRSERVRQGLWGATHAVLDPAESTAVFAAWDRLHPGVTSADELDRLHIDEHAREFFLWHPQEHESELLFSLPFEALGDRDVSEEFLRKSRVDWKYLDQIQRIRSFSTKMDPDSVRIILMTYVPRPGRLSRFYRVAATLDVPDTVAAKERMYQSIDVPLPDQRRVLGPKAERIEYVLAYRDLRRMLLPSLRVLHWDRDRSYQVWMWIRLVPQPIPADQGKGAPGILDGSASMERTWFDIPLH